MLLNQIKLVATATMILAAGAGALAYQTSDGRARAADRGLAPVAKASPRSAPSGPDLEARTRVVEEALTKPISPNLPSSTTLEAALKSIKAATQGPNNAGVPIYVDPIGLQEAGVAIDKPITVSLPVQPAPLNVILRQLLRPLGLDHDVNDGLLLISSRDLIVDQKLNRLTRELRALKEQRKNVH